MFKKNTSLVLLVTIIVIIFVSQSFVWTAPTDGCVEIKISKPNGAKSHFFGLNCMSCHTEGRGKVCFNVAGSVLDENRLKIHKNPVVKLYTEPNGKGKLVATIKGDALGNFYTTEAIDFSTGLYATLIGSPGAAEPVKHMRRPLIDGMGKCNKCHGNREEALGID